MDKVDESMPDEEAEAWSDEIETWLDEVQEELLDVEEAADEEVASSPEVPSTQPEGRGPMSPIGVRFQPAGKVYHFVAPVDMGLKKEDWVVVETVYGEQAGQVSEPDAKLPEGVSPKRLKTVLRQATALDMARFQLMRERAARMVEVAREEAKAQKLDMKIFAAEFTLDGAGAIVLGTGNSNKKDLTNFRRRLAARMNCRVEVRMVGPRDHAKTLCGYGVCGEERCCCRFLTEFQAVSIKMAKDQAISMAPTDITGMCGRLRCCLAYEHEVYKEEAKSLPKLKARVQTEKGLGRVIDLDILKAEIVVEIPPDGPRVERERFRFRADEVKVVT
ncbi:MAG TPA: regulatory iron-sulfur-containing complex subunit RicT [Anaerolineae bacterium]|nr:regulatory iron-sulfur-containing complex subunit RicT [Anaerolineae bacterium]HQH38894.1 regulatory iron-sulfur-containing complex subunit RicT [Anaerolineae bacterium]